MAQIEAPRPTNNPRDIDYDRPLSDHEYSGSEHDPLLSRVQDQNSQSLPPAPGVSLIPPTPSASHLTEVADSAAPASEANREHLSPESVLRFFLGSRTRRCSRDLESIAEEPGLFLGGSGRSYTTSPPPLSRETTFAASRPGSPTVTSGQHLNDIGDLESQFQQTAPVGRTQSAVEIRQQSRTRFDVPVPISRSTGDIRLANPLLTAQQLAPQNAQGISPPSHPPLHPSSRRPTADSKFTTMSDPGSYRANFTTLAGISIFGASVAFSSVFSGTRGDVIFLSWSASLFVIATVAAGAMGIIVDAGLHWDNMTARRVARFFAVFSALFAFGGILCLSIAVLWIAKMSANPFALDTRSRRLNVEASCYLAILLSLKLVIVAVFIRFRCGEGWKF